MLQSPDHPISLDRYVFNTEVSGRCFFFVRPLGPMLAISHPPTRPHPF